MLIHADVKSLELVTAAYLSKDPVLTQELIDGVDIHENNKSRFNLPDRRTAKVFVFRLIYGGQAYSYAHDSDFTPTSTSQDYWQEVIDRFYDKYPVMAKWHEQLVKEVLDVGCLTMPTGRVYSYPRADVAKRMWYWRPKILNYPVQGLGADLVAIARVAVWKRLNKAKLPHLSVSTVHDSLDIDAKTCYTSSIASIVKEAIADIPKNFERLFGVPFTIPVGCEIGYGPSLAELTPYKED